MKKPADEHPPNDSGHASDPVVPLCALLHAGPATARRRPRHLVDTAEIGGLKDSNSHAELESCVFGEILPWGHFRDRLLRSDNHSCATFPARRMARYLHARSLS